MTGLPLTEKRISMFLEDLARLSNEHGITIGGCGCCNSPFLRDSRVVVKYEATGYRSATFSSGDPVRDGDIEAIPLFSEGSKQ